MRSLTLRLTSLLLSLPPPVPLQSSSSLRLFNINTTEQSSSPAKMALVSVIDATAFIDATAMIFFLFLFFFAKTTVVQYLSFSGKHPLWQRENDLYSIEQIFT